MVRSPVWLALGRIKDISRRLDFNASLVVRQLIRGEHSKIFTFQRLDRLGRFKAFTMGNMGCRKRHGWILYVSPSAALLGALIPISIPLAKF